MRLLLDEVVGNYIDSLSEREFDAPFLALLRAQAFTDIHFLHGPFEFGKDFIAKREENGSLTQYAFQTKAGAIGLGVWRDVRGQIDELRTNVLAHPNFDKAARRTAVLVTTGRLVGGAPVDAQEYHRHVHELGEGTFEVWDRETLVERITTAPEVALAGRSEGPMLAILARTDDTSLTENQVEEYSRRWIHPSESEGLLWADAMEAAVIANRLRRADRLDLACYVALALLRGAWATGHGGTPSEIVLAVAETARSMFTAYANEIWDRCTSDYLDPQAFIDAPAETGFAVTYPIRCCRLVELLGLLGILMDRERSSEIVEFLSAFINANPGASHPVSDHWAVSLIPAVLLVSRGGNESAVLMLTEVTRWIGNHYADDGLGLAEPHASLEEELTVLLGSPLEHIDVSRRGLSYAATVALDLTAVLGLWDVYELARNDFRAVDAVPVLVQTADSGSQYVLDTSDLSLEIGVKYASAAEVTTGLPPAPHHRAPNDEFYLQRLGLFWDHLALAVLLRDRHVVATLRSLAGQSEPS